MLFPFLIVVLCLSSIGCSSLPENEKTDRETGIKNRAAEYTRFGNGFYAQAEYLQALDFYRMALNENISVDNEPGIIKSYNDLGKTYAAMGDLEAAADNYLEGYRIARDIGDPSLLILCEANLGEVFLREGDPDRAIEIFSRALERSFDETARSAILFHNAGQAYKIKGDLERAEELILEALRINTEAEEYREMASNYYALASIASKRGEFDRAVDYALSALENDKRMENSVGIAADLKALGLIYSRKGDAAEAYEYMKKGFLVYETLGITTQLVDILQHLEDLALALDRPAEAEVYRESLEDLKEP
jgi:tetratricopeptide (TPR) repeat protein